MYNFLNYDSLGTHEEERESQKQFKLTSSQETCWWFYTLLSSSKKLYYKSLFWSVQQKIEENEEDWQSPKGSALERQCVWTWWFGIFYP